MLGYETERAETTAEDIARRWKRIPMARVDFGQYRHALENYTYPPIRNVELNWWLEEGDTGILTIEVPPAAGADLPVLVVRAGEEGGKRRILVGIFARSGDRVGALLPAQIHAQLQMGRLVQQEELAGLSGQLNRTIGPSAEERFKRLASDAADAQLAGRRQYFLQAWPNADVRLRDMRTTGAGSVGEALTRPQHLRELGFGLRFGLGGSAAPIPGGGQRVSNGLFTWVVSGDSDGLAWGDGNRKAAIRSRLLSRR